MALYSPRLRRALTSFSTLRRSLSVVAVSPGISTPARQSPLLRGPTRAPSQPWALIVKSRSFRSTAAVTLLSARSSYNSNSTEEIDLDILLGKDKNHWLIIMDFPEDNMPSPEQMVQTYEETCAKGLNISVEEAKQKIYACSTTIYTGFQVVMTEKESEKFKGLPRVFFVLPDSYKDVVNKEYGGDKYINGTIIPRPPPLQYDRQGRSEEDQSEEELRLLIDEDVWRTSDESNNEFRGPSHIDQSFVITPSDDVGLQLPGSMFRYVRRRTYFIGNYP